MKLKLLFLAVAAMMFSCQPSQSEAEENDDEESPLEGAWEIVQEDVTTSDSSWSRKPYRSLIMYTDNHYSIEIAWRERASWPDRADGEDVSDENIKDAYNGLTSNSGEYEIRGDSIYYNAIIAKSPNFMNDWPKVARKFSLEGDQLVTNSKTFGGDGTTTTTYRRIE
ncbi:MAG TPA: lipocalin-like domain-containing protein [Cyclobacteriaceae bacterium]